MVEHYMAILPFEPNNWVLCHQPSSVEEAIILMETNAAAKPGNYLIAKAWKNKVPKATRGDCRPEENGCEEEGPFTSATSTVQAQ